MFIKHKLSVNVQRKRTQQQRFSNNASAIKISIVNIFSGTLCIYIYKVFVYKIN